MKKVIPFFCLLALASCSKIPRVGESGMEEINLSVWRGFNLLNMFIRGSGDDRPFNEKDFQTISEWGFNFVRIPMDYRIW
ncbi:MAG: hypothetical protein FWH38_04615, partial [Treponema sp.]|nr:hypothetical protein [Treponema sp.]